MERINQIIGTLKQEFGSDDVLKFSHAIYHHPRTPGEADGPFGQRYNSASRILEECLSEEERMCFQTFILSPYFTSWNVLCNLLSSLMNVDIPEEET